MSEQVVATFENVSPSSVGPSYLTLRVVVPEALRVDPAFEVGRHEAALRLSLLESEAYLAWKAAADRLSEYEGKRVELETKIAAERAEADDLISRGDVDLRELEQLRRTPHDGMLAALIEVLPAMRSKVQDLARVFQRHANAETGSQTFAAHERTREAVEAGLSKLFAAEDFPAIVARELERRHFGGGGLGQGDALARELMGSLPPQTLPPMIQPDRPNPSVGGLGPVFPQAHARCS
ncbi:MAG: hypothetical protein K2X38_00200 [Gemmataceae bacterium]|nr:hypothetical protein [Gemmataceae bacterium]